jgi:outer membrane lipopolysaccharide assembly protein LptE/RlpB
MEDLSMKASKLLTLTILASLGMLGGCGSRYRMRDVRNDPNFYSLSPQDQYAMLQMQEMRRQEQQRNLDALGASLAETNAIIQNGGRRPEKITRCTPNIYGGQDCYETTR